MARGPKVPQQALQFVEAGKVERLKVDAVVAPQAGELGLDLADRVELGGGGGHLRLGGGREHLGDADLAGLEEEGVEGPPEQLHPARKPQAFAGLVELLDQLRVHPQREYLDAAGVAGDALAGKETFFSAGKDLGPGVFEGVGALPLRPGEPRCARLFALIRS